MNNLVPMKNCYKGWEEGAWLASLAPDLEVLLSCSVSYDIFNIVTDPEFGACNEGKHSGFFPNS